MVTRLKALYDWLHTHEGRKIFRYTMVSVISTTVSLVVIAIVYGALHLWSEVPSTIFGNVVATFPSYWLNRKWAWGKHGRSHFMKEIVPFWTLAGIGIAFSIVGAAVARVGPVSLATEDTDAEREVEEEAEEREERDEVEKLHRAFCRLETGQGRRSFRRSERDGCY